MKLYSYKLWQVLIPAIIFFKISYAASVGDGTSMSISVVKSDDAKPLSDAVVKIMPLNGQNAKTKDVAGFTDHKGVFNYNFVEPVVIQISQLGYYTVIDTVYNPENKIYALVIKSQKINDVVVTGQYKPESAQKSVYEVKVIDADVIRAKGANNLREALTNELNIDFGQDPVFGSSMGINGISGEGVKIMVDGVPILGRMDGQVDLSSININNIERIEIVEGPLSVIYGTDAMGGVINIITKNSQAQKISVSLKTYYESVGQYNAEINAGFTFKKNQIFLSGGRNFFGGYSPFDTTRFQLWKPTEQYFADAKYLYTAERFRFGLSGSFFREVMLDKGGPVELPLGDSALTYGATDLHYLTYRGRGAASMMYRFKDAGQLDVLCAYSAYLHYSNQYTTDLVTLKQTPASIQDTTKYQQIEVRATYNMSAWKNRLNFLFGVDVNQEYTVDNTIENGKQQVGDYAAFGSARISVVEGLDIQPAVRFSYNTRFQVPLIPSLNIRYNYKDKILVRASYGRGFRSPSLNELFLSFYDAVHDLHGNPNLVPEDGSSLNGSFAYTKHFGKHTAIFTISGFYNNIRNQIQWAPLAANTTGTQQVTDQYINFKRYVTYGGRFNIGYRWGGLHADAAVQFTGYDLTPDSITRIKMWSPDFTFSAGYMIPKVNLGLNVNFKYDGLKPVFVINTGERGTRNAYSILSISATKNFWKDRIQLTMGGKNLLNVNNVLASNVTGVGHNVGSSDSSMGWGRTFFVTLVLNYSK